jgi:WD40 repeat protein
LPAHIGGVYGVALSGDGRLLVCGGQDGMVRLWEPRTGRLLSSLPAYTGGVMGVALSGDGQLATSGGVDGPVRLWETASGRLLASCGDILAWFAPSW